MHAPGLIPAGVGIVIISVLGALGLCSMLGIWSTLIIMEVIPFLVLAVGVDNMFILALLDSRQLPGTPLPERMAATLANAGPSILLASTCEAVAFGVAASAPMPAVRNFALCAMIAVILDFILQVRRSPGPWVGQGANAPKPIVNDLRLGGPSVQTVPRFLTVAIAQSHVVGR